MVVSVTGTLDLDGSLETGTITADGPTVDLQLSGDLPRDSFGNQIDSFGTSMTIRDGASVTVDDFWTLRGSNVDPSIAADLFMERGTLDGGEVRARGNIHVSGGGVGDRRADPDLPHHAR